MRVARRPGYNPVAQACEVREPAARAPLHLGEAARAQVYTWVRRPERRSFWSYAVAFLLQVAFSFSLAHSHLPSLFLPPPLSSPCPLPS